MPLTIDDEYPGHERWLQRTAEIRGALSSLAHPDSRVQARDASGVHWTVRILGVDWRSRLLFWRPGDDDLATPCGSLTADLLAADTLEFSATAHDGTWLQFPSAPPAVVCFADGSVLVISAFPSRMRHEPAPR